MNSHEIVNATTLLEADAPQRESFRPTFTCPHPAVRTNPELAAANRKFLNRYYGNAYPQDIADAQAEYDAILSRIENN